MTPTLRSAISGVVILFSLINVGLSVIIVPAPSVGIESITTHSITLNWTVPINEAFDDFLIEVYSEGAQVASTVQTELRFELTGLVPGVLYTFLVRATRDELISDTVVISQDTVPFPPANLDLRYFDRLVLTLAGPFFGNTEFTIDMAGIEATWDGPVEGECDCYVASINPNDGRQVIPATDNEADPGERSRQFIHLVPGQTYTVSVYSTTCGNGSVKDLMSEIVTSTLTIPPADPPPIVPERITNVTSFLSWVRGGVIPGFYDDFEVTLLTETEDPVLIIPALIPTTRGREVVGLEPCSEYEFEVYTLNNGMRSTNSQRATLYTKPTMPSRLEVRNYGTDFISVDWQQYGRPEDAEYRVRLIQASVVKTVSDKEIIIGSLMPGTEYNISVATVCLTPERTESRQIFITQLTRPLPPASLEGICQITPTSDTISSIQLRWTPPVVGDWDEFVVDYSPFVFEPVEAKPLPPISLSSSTFGTEITVPVTGRTFSAYIRSRKRNLLSDGVFASIDCPDADGRTALRCRAGFCPQKWNITVEAINDGEHLQIEVPPNPVFNITVETGPRPAAPLVTKDTTIIIRNPCATDSNLRIFVYPLPSDAPANCPTEVVRQYCGYVQDPNEDIKGDSVSFLNSPSNACCNSRKFDTNISRCCHGVLLNGEQPDMDCCFTKWYDRTFQKCCGQTDGLGVVKPSSARC